MNITFDLGNDDDRDNNMEIWVHVDDLIPVLPPAYFSATRTTPQIIDRTYYSYDSELTWLEKNHPISFIHDVEEYKKNNYRIGNSYHGYVPLVHKLNHYNITSNYLVLPQETVPKVMFMKGDLHMVSLRPIPMSYRGKYMISESEETLKIKGWRNAIKASTLPLGDEYLRTPQIGDRLICILQWGDAGVHLFYVFLPKREQ